MRDVVHRSAVAAEVGVGTPSLHNHVEGRWLDPDTDRAAAAAMCADRSAPAVRLRPVSSGFNRVGQTDPALLDTVEIPSGFDVRV